MAPSTRFILNDRLVETSAPAGLLLLDFLRNHERLTGTKEGCKEGDCGACAVLIGELAGDAVRYQPATSCLVPLAEVHGRHVVTIEGCNLDAGLTPAQEAVVEHGGTQCGFCTPGIVVSLHGLLLDDTKRLSLEDVKYALSGHLCRCTGYRSLKDCADTLDRRLGSRLDGIGGGGQVSGANPTRRVAALAAAGAIPGYFTTIAERLRALQEETPAPDPDADPDVRIAGGTDLYVQQGEEIPDCHVEVLNRRPALKRIRRSGGEFRVGALTTFEEFGADPRVVEALPRIGAFNHLIASWQIRNRATLAGNIVNASPIGDFTALLLALDARVVLDDGGTRRSVPLREFYRGYKQMDLRPGELLTEVAFADPAGARVNFEKVSKRTCLDIASVNSACSIRCTGDTIADAHVSVGGVAPIPLYLHETSRALRGSSLDLYTAWEAVRLSQQEIAPITDVRGSAEYKRLLARQLLIAHFVTLFPDRFTVEAFHARGVS
ncbi:MAG: FAD binding domain-containing protein [Spirochaetaceae bacterium]|nr:FAD binding domain-containing protein [Spirochaetaceae bacterium]